MVVVLNVKADMNTISLIKNYLKVGGSLNKQLLMFKVGFTSYAVQ